ncbi:MAG: Sec-independent protein translocase protein TatB [Pseudomonadota bacterium]
MFDIGFAELLIIFVIGLLVLGPERLPRVAARIGNWVGQARRMTRNLRYQLEDEIAYSERKEQAEQLIADIKEDVSSVNDDIKGAVEPISDAVKSADAAVNKET